MASLNNSNSGFTTHLAELLEESTTPLFSNPEQPPPAVVIIPRAAYPHQWAEFIVTFNAWFANPFILLGLITNALNIVVFFRQGLQDSVSVNLFALSISDFLNCVFQTGLAVNRYISTWDPGHHIEPFSLGMAAYAYPRSATYFFSTCLTVFLSVERSLCVLMPFKFKAMFTLRRTYGVLVTFLVLTVAIFAPIFFTQGLSWRFDPRFNKTRLLLYILPAIRRNVNVYFVTLSSLVVPIVSEVGVGVSTLLMIQGLRVARRFKDSATRTDGDDAKSDRLSGKELRAVRMVLSLSIIFVVCNMPLVVTGVAQIAVPQFKQLGRHHLLYMMSYSFVFLFGTFNACLNFFVYVSQSTRFKEVLLSTLGFCFECKGGEKVSGKGTEISKTATTSG